MSMGRNQYGVTDEELRELMEYLARPEALSPEERKREWEADDKRREEDQHERDKRERARREKNKKARIAQELKIAAFVDGCGTEELSFNDTLAGMGFKNYEDYLASPFWRKIKRRIRKRDGDRCLRCSDEYLVCLCEGCHYNIHFDDHDRQRSHQEKERLLHEQDTRTDFPKPKVDLRIRRRNEYPPEWKRMTAVQRRGYAERRFEEIAKKKLARARTQFDRLLWQYRLNRARGAADDSPEQISLRSAVERERASPRQVGQRPR